MSKKGLKMVTGLTGMYERKKRANDLVGIVPIDMGFYNCNGEYIHRGVFEMENLARIEIIKTEDESICIDRLENFMTEKDIIEKYGNYVLKNYRESDVFFCMVNNRMNIEYIVESDFIRTEIKEGQVLSKELFEEIIMLLKKGSKNLKKACDERNKYKSSIVEI